MSLVAFDTLPDTARLWVYNTEHELEEQELQKLQGKLDAFFEKWAAHGSRLTVGYEIRERRFLLVGVDDSQVGPSGCSIDKLVRYLKELDSTVGVRIIDAPDVCFRSGGEIHCVKRSEFEALAREGAVSADTIVFDRTVGHLRDLRAGNWELPAARAWHAKAFGLTAGS